MNPTKQKPKKKPSYHNQRAQALKSQANTYRCNAVEMYDNYEKCARVSRRYKRAGRITFIAALLVRWAMKLTRKADAEYKKDVPKDVPSAEEHTHTADNTGMNWADWCNGIDAEIALDKARSAVLPQVDA